MNSLFRIKAVLVKEFRQLSRDRITFGMVVMIPLIQLYYLVLRLIPMCAIYRLAWWIKATPHSVGYLWNPSKSLK